MTAESKPKRKRGEVYDTYNEPQGEGLGIGGLLLTALAACFFAIVGLVRWCWNTFTRFVGFLWHITSGVMMWTLRLSGRILAWTWDKSIWAIKLPFRLSAWLLWGLMRWYHGAPVDADAPPLTQLHGLVRRFYRRRSRFIAHGFAFAMVNGLVWLQWLIVARPYSYGFPDGMLFSTVFWLFLLGFHFVRMKMGENEDRALRAIVEQHGAFGLTSGYEEVSYESSHYSRLAADEVDHTAADEAEQWAREQCRYKEKPKRR